MVGVVFGSAASLAPAVDLVDADLIFQSAETGRQVSEVFHVDAPTGAAGDVFVIGAPGIASGAGAVYAFYGHSGLVGEVDVATADLQIVGASGMAMGSDGLTAADMDADGRPELVVPAAYASAVMAFELGGF